jgi:hypothetical protein
MNYEQELHDLKSQVATLTAENEEFRTALKAVNLMIDGFEQGILDVAMQANFAHDKVNCLIYQNPAIVDDLATIEDIVGPMGNSTPNAPANS